jgi:hypothetical protein
VKDIEKVVHESSKTLSKRVLQETDRDMLAFANCKFMNLLRLEKTVEIVQAIW